MTDMRSYLVKALDEASEGRRVASRAEYAAKRAIEVFDAQGVPVAPESPVTEEPAPEKPEPVEPRAFSEPPTIVFHGSHAHVGDTLAAVSGMVPDATSYRVLWRCGEEVLGEGNMFVPRHACHVVAEITAVGDGWEHTETSAEVKVGEAHAPEPVEPVPTPEPTPEPEPPAEPEPEPPAGGNAFVTVSPTFHATPEILAQYTVPDERPLDPDDESKWRFGMSPTGQLGHFDPMVHHGVEEMDHLHVFDGEYDMSPHTTVEELIGRTGPNTSVCGAMTRLTKWQPAAITEDGMVKFHDRTDFYYHQQHSHRRYPALPEGTDVGPLYAEANALALKDGIDKAAARDIVWSREEKAYHDAAGTEFDTIFVPNGINILAGSFITGPSTGCTFKLMVPGFKTVEGPNLDAAVAAWHDIGGSGDTPPGTELRIAINILPCWNGDLTSPDFRSHLSGFAEGKLTGYRAKIAPASHPFVIIDIDIFVKYTQREGEVPISRLRWSNDKPGFAAGEFFHVDYVPLHTEELRRGVWEDIIKAKRQVSTSGPTIMIAEGIRARNPEHFITNGDLPQRFVPIPASSAGMHHGH